uniref:GPR180/TMEM145 transmembrane domain-containing protein n=1 Tax=Acrobeloides nanus TaxID=290746 RepID=A0A914EEC3_9BILA
MTLWFWAGPITLIFANFVLDNWVRAEVVHGVDSAVVIYGFIIFLALTSPISANRNFPYHVRTNQISEINFPQNIYEVQYSTNNQNSNPDTSNSNTNANGLYRH